MSGNWRLCRTLKQQCHLCTRALGWESNCTSTPTICLTDSQPTGSSVTYLLITSFGSHLAWDTSFAFLLHFKQWLSEPISPGWDFLWLPLASPSAPRYPKFAHVGVQSSLRSWWAWHLLAGSSVHSQVVPHRTNWQLESLRVTVTR